MYKIKLSQSNLLILREILPHFKSYGGFTVYKIFMSCGNLDGCFLKESVTVDFHADISDYLIEEGYAIQKGINHINGQQILELTNKGRSLKYTFVYLPKKETLEKKKAIINKILTFINKTGKYLNVWKIKINTKIYQIKSFIKR
jgi:hypothetical protein